MDLEMVKKALRKKVEKPVEPVYLSTGSTLLNLACSDRIDGGFRAGHYYHLVGDSKSGKTFLSLTCFAEASIDDIFKDYRLIYDGPEHGALMDVRRFFGERVADRIEPICSELVEDFYFNLDDAVGDGRPFVYVLDSMDALDADADEKKFQQQKRKRRGTATKKDEDAGGTYGTAKAKVNSTTIRKFMSRLERSGSVLIVISQTRDNLKFGAREKTWGGGHSLLFYSTLEIWSKVAEQITRTVRGKKRQVGTWCQVQVRKNRQSGKDRSVLVPIYHSFGIDDLGGCVDYLVDEGYWKENKQGVIDAVEFDCKGRFDTIIKHIEEKGLERNLRQLVGKVWADIEKGCEIQRKRRY